jgi:hypothetical protein
VKFSQTRADEPAKGGRLGARGVIVVPKQLLNPGQALAVKLAAAFAGCVGAQSVVVVGHQEHIRWDRSAHRLRISFAAALARSRRRGNGPGTESAGILVAVMQGMNVMAKSRPGWRALQDVIEATLPGFAVPPVEP